MHTTGDDQKKRYAYAVIARNVRRIAAIVSRSRVEEQLRQQLLAALEQLHHQAWLVLYDWDTGEMLEGEDTYSDGSQVTTTLDWGEGTATLVRSPISGEQIDVGPGDLADELWLDY